MKISPALKQSIQQLPCIRQVAEHSYRAWISAMVEGRYHLRRKGRSHGLHAPLIVSLTSYPARFSTLARTLKCLISQNIAADRIILWIAHADWDLLPREVLYLKNAGLEISRCDDLRSYKKIVPTLRLYPESFVVTADDDMYYWPTWLEDLVRVSLANHGQVICHYAHQIALDTNGLPLSYRQWGSGPHGSQASPLVFQVGAGGVLYPPGALHNDATEETLFKFLCPLQDDVWLYWMMRMSGAVARTVGAERAIHSWPGSQQVALFRHNADDGHNDEQIKMMIEHYGFPGGKK